MTFSLVHLDRSKGGTVNAVEWFSSRQDREADMKSTENVTDAEDRALRAAIARALDAHRTSGRTGIAAAIIYREEIIETAENEVDQTDNPTQHAEIVAITAASRSLSREALAQCTLISTLQPCEMCLAAMRFSGIGRVVFAATQARVAAKYFVFPGFGIDDFASASDTAFSYAGGVRETDVLHLYADGEE